MIRKWFYLTDQHGNSFPRFDVTVWSVIYNILISISAILVTAAGFLVIAGLFAMIFRPECVMRTYAVAGLLSISGAVIAIISIPFFHLDREKRHRSNRRRS